MSIYLVQVLTLLNGMSVRAARVLLALYALELGASPLAVGMLAATFSAFPMVLVVPAGQLADRFGSRWLLIFGAVGGGLGMLVPYIVPGLPALFVAVAMIGLSTAIYNVSLQNDVGLMSDAHTRAKNFSNYSLMSSLAMVAGPLIAGFSIERWGHADSCLGLALFTLAPVAMLAFSRGRPRPGARQVAHAGAGVRAMLSEPGVGRVLATSSFLHAGSDLYAFYMPVYTHGIGFSASTIGIVLAMNSAAMFAVRLVLPRLIATYGEEKVLACVFYVGAASLMLVPFFKDAVMLSLISFAFGLGMGCGQPIVLMLMFSNSAEGRSGTALGLRMSVNHFTKIVGPVLFGSIGSAFGLFPMFWISALMMGTGGMLSRPAANRGGRRR